MRFVFPFPTSLPIKQYKSLKYLCALLVSDYESCSIHYTYLDRYDMDFELDSFRILAESPRIINVETLDEGDFILLDTFHDITGGRAILTEQEHKQSYKINVPEVFAGDFSGYNNLSPEDQRRLRSLNSVKANFVMLDPDNYLLSLMKEIIIKNAVLEGHSSIHDAYEVHKDLFEGPLYLPFKIAEIVHSSFRPDLTNRQDTLSLIVPKSYRFTP
jgi:hypothetical protein